MLTLHQILQQCSVVDHVCRDVVMVVESWLLKGWLLWLKQGLPRRTVQLVLLQAFLGAQGCLAVGDGSC